jgi:hypothetical protein
MRSKNIEVTIRKERSRRRLKERVDWINFGLIEVDFIQR